MPAANLKTLLSSTFVGAIVNQHPLESFDELAYGGMITGIDLWDPNLFPGQNSAFGSVANSVPNKGANTFASPGGGTVDFLGGGIDFNATVTGLSGIKVGALATASVLHVNDFTQFGGSFTASIAGTVMTVTALASGAIIPNMNLSGTGVSADTQVVKQLTGTAGGVGTYRVGLSQAVASTAITGVEEFLVSTLYKVTVAPTGNAEVIVAQSDSGAASGKFQFGLEQLNSGGGGLRVIVAGVALPTGFVPTTNKIYAIGAHIVPNPAGLTKVNLYIYNVSDGAAVYDGSAFFGTYAAFVAMVNGGTMIGTPVNITSRISPQGMRIYGLLGIERISLAGVDPAERFGMQVKRAVALFEAGTIS